MDGVASERTQEGFADAELLAGMRAGNPAAFAALMRSNNRGCTGSLVIFSEMIWRPRRPFTMAM
jgi:hypothetical protein